MRSFDLQDTLSTQEKQVNLLMKKLSIKNSKQNQMNGLFFNIDLNQYSIFQQDNSYMNMDIEASDQIPQFDLSCKLLKHAINKNDKILAFKYIMNEIQKKQSLSRFYPYIQLEYDSIQGFYCALLKFSIENKLDKYSKDICKKIRQSFILGEYFGSQKHIDFELCQVLINYLKLKVSGGDQKSIQIIIGTISALIKINPILREQVLEYYSDILCKVYAEAYTGKRRKYLKQFVQRRWDNQTIKHFQLIVQNIFANYAKCYQVHKKKQIESLEKIIQSLYNLDYLECEKIFQLIYNTFFQNISAIARLDKLLSKGMIVCLN